MYLYHIHDSKEKKIDYEYNEIQDGPVNKMMVTFEVEKFSEFVFTNKKAVKRVVSSNGNQQTNNDEKPKKPENKPQNEKNVQKQETPEMKAPDTGIAEEDIEAEMMEMAELQLMGTVANIVMLVGVAKLGLKR